MSKKELIKENIVEAPTLFVGVGGTGSGIVTKVAEMCRPGEVENIKFVCLDTNVNDLTNVAKSKADIYFVQTSNTQTVGSYLDYDDDARKNWFPKNAVMYDKTVSEGAGQVRAISRLALNATIKTGAINSLYDAIDSLFRKTGKQMKQALRVVVVSTASGGTGSGIILPLCMFIRDYVNNKYPNTALIVRSMIMLPETLDSVIKSTAERESQRRNAYATIKELNAFMIKGSGFMDMGGELEKFRNLHVDFAIPGTNEKKSLSLLPCDFCFLMDGQNAEDTTMISINQYKVQAAQALYEQNIGPMQKKAFSVEDNIIKEMANPGNYGRNRFGGIGAAVIKYPYEDLVDYVACGWAMDSIGGEGESAKWTKYDNEFEIKLRDGRKKGLSEAEMPKRSEVFISKVNTSTDNFSKDIRARYNLEDAADKVANYITALTDEVKAAVRENNLIGGARTVANALAGEVDYDDENNKGKASENLSNLHAYLMAVNANAQKVAANLAEAIFHSEEIRTINEKKEFTLEKLIKNNADEIYHPIAIRYMLYCVRDEFATGRDTAKSTINDLIRPALRNYADDADLPDMFDVKSTKKSKEGSLSDYCAAEKEDPNLFERMGTKAYYEGLNTFFPDYFSQIGKLADAIAESEAYSIGYEVVDELCKAFEKFFKTFPEKVSTLLRKQDDIVAALKFVKGDSVYPICATEEIMKELARYTASQQTEDTALLSSELNGDIFDAVKKNVAFEREIRNMDVVENDKRKDIFDEIMLGYFRDSVRDNCESLDVNIIQAIALENRLTQRIKLREQAGGNEQVIDKVTTEDSIRHIREIIGVGERLAAPGIEKIRNEESREINLCAYNKKLNDMREYRMGDLLPNGDAVDTVSRYELHFFNAMYNLTPDKLNKFAAANKTETRDRNAGLYHKAYTEYAKHIGPDSTKNMMISTHIDKRWDSIAVMPELDFGYQERQVMKIHQAMIYGLIFNAITFRKLSTAYGGKRVYKYENSEERYLDLIVSNGTLCDEFYEILDSLYISSAIVGDIEVITGKKHAKDKVKNSNYDQTVFAKSLEEFVITDLHEGVASLFEIPLFYYNSLPNSMRFTGEITAMVDAVIKTYTDELVLCEKDVDVKPKLCMILQQQFELLMKNFKTCAKLSDNTKASENEVIDIIYRRIKSVLSTTPEPDDYEILLEDMKKLIQK